MRAPLAVLALVLAGCDSSPAGPAPNHPPFIVSASPGEGDIITIAGTPGREVETTLADEDLGDHLFLRYLVDYPAGTETANKLIRELELPPSGSMIRANVHLQPSCALLSLQPGVHRLMLSASDRAYLDPLKGDDVDPEAPLDSVPVDANRLRAVWLLDCP